MAPLHAMLNPARERRRRPNTTIAVPPTMDATRSTVPRFVLGANAFGSKLRTRSAFMA